MFRMHMLLLHTCIFYVLHAYGREGGAVGRAIMKKGSHKRLAMRWTTETQHGLTKAPTWFDLKGV
jgi:hypothetical protein